MAPQMATGVPLPAAPFEKGAEREADEDGLNAGVAGQPGHGSADNVELARLDRHVIDQHRIEDGPANGQEAEGGFVEKGRACRKRRHSENKNRDGQGGKRGGDGGLEASASAQRHQ